MQKKNTMNDSNWSMKGIGIQLDITTYCNAKCPQCHRTNPEGLKKHDWLPLVHWSMDDFNTAFSDDDLTKISNINFCPTWGDAIMNPHFYDMVKRCFEVNPNMCISIDTNGSIQDENLWWKFGSLAPSKRNTNGTLRVTFDVDGINQKMHSKYRIGTNLQKTLNNMRAYSEAYYSKTCSQTIVFKHNQEYLKQIEKLCAEYGSTYHINTKSTNRFGNHGNDNTFEFTFANGKFDTLEKSDIIFEESSRLSRHKNIDQTKINCQWKKRNHVNINYTGNVHPCCYFGNREHDANDGSRSQKFLNHLVIQSYTKNNNNNIFSNKLEDIISNNWFKQTLPESWNSENPVPQCSKFCKNQKYSVEMVINEL